jgi:hypothetical protein
MTHLASWSWKLKITAGIVGMTAGTLGMHTAHIGASEEAHIRQKQASVMADRDSRIQERRVVEAANCHSGGDGTDGNDDRSGHPGQGDEQHGTSDQHGVDGTRHDTADDPHHKPKPQPTGMVLQPTSVQLAATDFLRIDKSGKVVSAATNTGCAPRVGDEVFVFRPNGNIDATTKFDVTTCRWTGDFTIAGRFQPQDCRRDQHDS